MGDSIDYTAGVKLSKKYGDYVTVGEVIAIMYSNDEARIDAAGQRLLNAYQFSNHRLNPLPLVIDTIK